MKPYPKEDTLATKVSESEELELQDGTVVEVKPLSIKKLRKFMELVKGFEDSEDEQENLGLMVKACAIALENAAPELAADMDRLEDALDVPTIWRILEIAGGVKMNDPNLMAAVPAGMTST